MAFVKISILFSNFFCEIYKLIDIFCENTGRKYCFIIKFLQYKIKKLCQYVDGMQWKKTGNFFVNLKI